MSATAFERHSSPAARRASLSGAHVAGRGWQFFLPLLIGLGIAAILAGSGAAGACSGTGITLSELPEANAALRGALG